MYSVRAWPATFTPSKKILNVFPQMRCKLYTGNSRKMISEFISTLVVCFLKRDVKLMVLEMIKVIRVLVIEKK